MRQVNSFFRLHRHPHPILEMNKGLPNETADDWVTGTRAAVVGGTTVLDFAEPLRGCSLASALDTWTPCGRQSLLPLQLPYDHQDWDPRIRAELKDMTAAGITSYKVYLAYDNLRVSDAAAYEVIRGGGGGRRAGLPLRERRPGHRGHQGEKPPGPWAPRPTPLRPPPGGGRGH